MYMYKDDNYRLIDPLFKIEPNESIEITKLIKVAVPIMTNSTKLKSVEHCE